MQMLWVADTANMGKGGEGKEQARVRTSFHWDTKPEPHAERKSKILKAHPEIKTLMGPCMLLHTLYADEFAVIITR